jgi:methylated-DNA-[protein]-cysteine S-methyltransferase
MGPLLLAATARGLYRVHFGAQIVNPEDSEQEWIECAEELAECKDQLRRYFCGELHKFSLNLDLRGTKFQVRCWEALRHIPYGGTCTYADIAREVGRPRAFRAVGQANHHNPVAIIVPCHRVIGSNGTLTGYGGGLTVKEQLLLLESRQLQPAFAFS